MDFNDVMTSVGGQVPIYLYKRNLKEIVRPHLNIYGMMIPPYSYVRKENMLNFMPISLHVYRPTNHSVSSNKSGLTIVMTIEFLCLTVGCSECPQPIQ